MFQVCIAFESTVTWHSDAVFLGTLHSECQPKFANLESVGSKYQTTLSWGHQALNAHLGKSLNQTEGNKTSHVITTMAERVHLFTTPNSLHATVC